MENTGVWFKEVVAPEEIVFDSGVFLPDDGEGRGVEGWGRRERAGTSTRGGAGNTHVASRHYKGTCSRKRGRSEWSARSLGALEQAGNQDHSEAQIEGSDPRISVEFSVTTSADSARSLQTELQQILADLNLSTM